jgi:hypothetical protein
MHPFSKYGLLRSAPCCPAGKSVRLRILSVQSCLQKHFAFGVGLDPGIRRRQAQKFSSHRLAAHSLIS